MSYFWIFLGGGLGSIARFAGSGFIAHHFGETFPWSALLVNLTGSFIIGCFATLKPVAVGAQTVTVLADARDDKATGRVREERRRLQRGRAIQADGRRQAPELPRC